MEAKYHSCADSRHIYIVLVSACAIPFLLITHTEYTPPNHQAAGNLVNLSRGTCRSKGQGVLMRRCLFFIHNRRRKLQPHINQKEGRKEHSFELHPTVKHHGFWSQVMSSARPSGKSSWNVEEGLSTLGESTTVYNIHTCGNQNT